MTPGSVVGIKKFVEHYESTINVMDALNVVFLSWKTFPMLNKIDSGAVFGIGYGTEAKRGLMKTNELKSSNLNLAISVEVANRTSKDHPNPVS